MYHYLEIFPWFLSLPLQSLHIYFFSPKMLISENNTLFSCQMANLTDFRALLNKNGQMIDWIVTKFLIIAQDVIKLHSNKNFNVFSLGILKCVSFWRRHIFYQKVFICPSMLHKHFMVLKKTWKGTGYFFFKRCNQIFFKVANLYAIYFYISIFIPHKNNNKKNQSRFH